MIEFIDGIIFWLIVGICALAGGYWFIDQWERQEDFPEDPDVPVSKFDDN